MIRTLLQIAISILAITAANASPRVSLLTFFPGSEIYELEGHTALRVVDGRGDTAYNWGTFDFLAPGFVYRFVSGQTDYMVAAAPTDLFLSYYADSGRRVVEQEHSKPATTTTSAVMRGRMLLCLLIFLVF